MGDILSAYGKDNLIIFHHRMKQVFNGTKGHRGGIEGLTISLKSLDSRASCHTQYVFYQGYILGTLKIFYYNPNLDLILKGKREWS